MNYQYFGLFLNEHNRNELMKIIFANPIIANLVLQRGSTLYLDHCTLLHRNQNDKEIYDSLVKKIDESWMVEVNGIGFSNKAIAFRVTIPDLPCANAKPHITICTINGGKPVDSNGICEWISRAKKIYNSYKEFYVPIKGIKDYRTRFTFGSVRVCESITDFLNDSKYAKMLKNCTSPYRSKMMQYEYKKENRKDRYKAKKDIQEGIQEYESRDNLSCSSCIFYDGGLCEKGLLMTDDCPEYWD